MRTKNECGFSRLSIAAAWIALVLAAPAAGQVTSRVSVDSNGAQANKDAFDPTISLDGRYVTFFCYDDLLDEGTSTISELFVHSDVYLYDRHTGTIERISVSSSEAQGDSYSYGAPLSSDARYAVFSSYATNLVPGDTNGPYPVGMDAFVRDRQSGTTERVSVDSSGAQGNGESGAGGISADGRYVVLGSRASNLVPGDTNAASDVFVRDRQAGTTERVSLDSNGAQGNGDSFSPQISADGRYVAFYSSASDLVPGDTNAIPDVFVRDRQMGTTERVSVDSSGGQGNGDSYVSAISADARFVVFDSFASNLVGSDTNGVRDVFLRDRQLGTTERVSVDSGGAQGNGESHRASISPDARYVAFQSNASNLVSGDVNGARDIFVRDRQSGTTERVSVDSNGAEGQADSGIQGPSISADGRFVAFDSRANLVEQDTNSWHDIYVRDRDYSPMASLCDPGVAGVIACPCSNPPGGLGRGCDNSAGTGGAILSASGVAYLSQDTLVFTTSGEKPIALSIVTQWTGTSASGAVFGQGVRCTSGTLKRLYTKIASGGSITAPNFGAGDPSVSARSATLGDEIPPGQSRWYVVYYRDPIVLGGCPATSTFNATQTGEVAWLP